MKAWLSKVWAGFKGFLRWFRRIFEDAAGLPSSKRIFGAGLLLFGIVAVFKLDDPLMAGVLVGGGLGMFGVSSWTK